jgi:hypothetical protein
MHEIQAPEGQGFIHIKQILETYTQLCINFEVIIELNLATCFFKNEVELAYYTPRIMSKTYIKIKTMDACKESWLLFFKEILSINKSGNIVPVLMTPFIRVLTDLNGNPNKIFVVSIGFISSFQ